MDRLSVCSCFARDQYFTSAPVLVPQPSAVFTVWVPVPVMPVCSGILPVMEHHDVETGAVSKPIAAAGDDIASVPRDRE